MISRIIEENKAEKLHHERLMKMPYFQGQDVVLESDLSELDLGKDIDWHMEGAIVHVEDVNPYTRIYKVRKRDIVLWVERKSIDRDKSEELEDYIGWP